MKIALDVFGGDNAPSATVRGAIHALGEARLCCPELEIVLVGNIRTLQLTATQSELQQFELVDIQEIKSSDEIASLRSQGGGNTDTAIRVAHRLLRQGKVDAVVSAGSTGAQVSAALTELEKCSGITRPAVGAFLPTATGKCYLLDVGSSLHANANHLVRFAAMGHVYAQDIIGIQSPRIGVLNVARERSAGDMVAIQAYSMLEDSCLNFIGFVEGRDIPSGFADVVVTNGFVGNTLLKLMEGLPPLLQTLVSKQEWSSIAQKFDYHQVGGEPLLGVRGVSVICHGAATDRAISAAILKAAKLSELKIYQKVDTFLDNLFSGKFGSAKYAYTQNIPQKTLG